MESKNQAVLSKLKNHYTLYLFKVVYSQPYFSLSIVHTPKVAPRHGKVWLCLNCFHVARLKQIRKCVWVCSNLIHIQCNIVTGSEKRIHVFRTSCMLKISAWPAARIISLLSNWASAMPPTVPEKRLIIIRYRCSNVFCFFNFKALPCKNTER